MQKHLIFTEDEYRRRVRKTKEVMDRAGMTIHFMPGIWLDDYGFECSEPVLVTDSGCEKFIEFPQELFFK